MPDWRKYNRTASIPQNILATVLPYTKGKTVIDVGAGPDATKYVDFLATKTIRIEVENCRRRPVNESIEHKLRDSRNLSPIVLVFFRVLSILPCADLCNLRHSILALHRRIRFTIVYDYTFDDRKINEYEVVDSWMGTGFRLAVEWSEDVFHHLSRENIERIIPFEPLHEEYMEIPAHKREDGRGILMVLQPPQRSLSASP
jgi:hypothetical protein